MPMMVALPDTILHPISDRVPKCIDHNKFLPPSNLG